MIFDISERPAYCEYPVGNNVCCGQAVSHIMELERKRIDGRRLVGPETIELNLCATHRMGMTHRQLEAILLNKLSDRFLDLKEHLDETSDLPDEEIDG
jgi:hypothetical protein